MTRSAAPSWPATGADSDSHLVPRRRKGVHGVELDSESVLYDERTGRLHLLNFSASAVWWSIDGIASVEELASTLAERFTATPELMRSDVEQLLGVLGGEQLVEAVRSRARRPTNV